MDPRDNILFVQWFLLSVQTFPIHPYGAHPLNVTRLRSLGFPLGYLWVDENLAYDREVARLGSCLQENLFVFLHSCFCSNAVYYGSQGNDDFWRCLDFALKIPCSLTFPVQLMAFLIGHKVKKAQFSGFSHYFLLPEHLKVKLSEADTALNMIPYSNAT